MRRVTMTVVLTAGVALGCSAQLGSGGEHLGHDEGEQTVSPVNVIDEWQRDGDWLVSPALSAPDGASRVGLLVGLEVPGDLPVVEARPIAGDAPVGGWLRLDATWSEENYHVAIAELGQTADGAQIRIPVDDVDRIRTMRWNAVIPDEPEEASVEEGEAGSARAALRSELAGLGIVTREAWGARRTRCSGGDSAKRRMAVHYTVTPSEDAERQVRAIQRYHMDSRGWCDVGYHFLVGIDGTIYEGRPLHIRGAHVGGNNSGNIGISFVGCFDPGSACARWAPQRPPEAMLRKGGELIGTLSRLYGIDVTSSTVKGHRDHAGAGTNCPGAHLHARLEDMRAIGRTSTLSGGSTPEPEPEPEPEPTEPPAPTSCDALSCGTCEATAGCRWCASRGACLRDSGACAWRGTVGDDACWDGFWPCWRASCWNPTADVAACGTWSKDEDFSSGRYSVHRYWASLPAGGPVTIRLERTAGGFAPALLVTDRDGRLIHGGDGVRLHPDVAVTHAVHGRSGTAAEVTLEAARTTSAFVYVTGWEIVDAGFGGSMPRTARYRLSATQTCGG